MRQTWPRENIFYSILLSVSTTTLQVLQLRGNIGGESFIFMNESYDIFYAPEKRISLQLSESLNQINSAWSRSPPQSDVLRLRFTLDVPVATSQTQQARNKSQTVRLHIIKIQNQTSISTCRSQFYSCTMRKRAVNKLIYFLLSTSEIRIVSCCL